MKGNVKGIFDLCEMKALSEHIFRFIDCFESVLNDQGRIGIKHRIEFEKVNDLVYVLSTPENKLVILYYLPGSSRVIDFPEGFETPVIHIDEDAWINKPELLLSRIKVLLGKGIRVFARQCVVARIEKKEALRFQKEHHLQIAMPGKYRYGLFLEGELMSIAIFSGGRNMKHTENYRSFECIRFCSKQGYVVVGGLSKLLKAFIHDFKPNDIMTYVDMDWSDGKKFENTGFVKVSILDPQTFWVNRESHERISDKDYENLRADFEDRLIPERNFLVKEQEDFSNFDCSNYYKVVNCGSIKMVFLARYK